MPQTRPPYPPQFRAEAVRLVRESGKPMAQIARDLGVSVESLRNLSSPDVQWLFVNFGACRHYLLRPAPEFDSVWTHKGAKVHW